MNEKKARKQGLEFTGDSSLCLGKENIKRKAQIIKDEGYKTVIVEDEIGRTAIFAERKYFIGINITNLECSVENNRINLLRLQQEYQKKVVNEQDKNRKIKIWIEELKKERQGLE